MSKGKAKFPQNVQYLLLFAGIFTVICGLAGFVLISIPMRHSWGLENLPNYPRAVEIIQQDDQIFKDLDHATITTAPTIGSIWNSHKGKTPDYLLHVDVYAPWKKPGSVQLALHNSGNHGPVSYKMSWRHNGTTRDMPGIYRGGE